MSSAPFSAAWTDAIDLLTQSQMDLASNVNLGLVCDHLALRWARMLAVQKGDTTH